MANTSTSQTYASIGSPFGQYWGNPNNPQDIKVIQAKGYSGDPKYWKSYNYSPGRPPAYYYDFTGEKADITKYGTLKDQMESAKTQAEIDYLQKQTDILGRPKQSVASTTFVGPEPTMGELSTFNMPTRPGTPEFTMPEMGEMPEFVAPEYDERQIAKMAQQNAAPGVRNLRTAIQAVTSRRGDNPNVDKMTLRDALAGYGQGLEEVMSGARQTASAEYAQKYAMEYKTAGMNWEQAVQTVRDKYAGAMEGRKMEYQAEMDAVNQVYSASVQAESQRVAAENQKVMTIFEAAMQKYLAGATKTTTESYL